MTLTFKNGLGDKVGIEELNKNGIVMGIHISQSGTEYNVRYFQDGQPYTTYFFEFELTKPFNLPKEIKIPTT